MGKPSVALTILLGIMGVLFLGGFGVFLFTQGILAEFVMTVCGASVILILVFEHRMAKHCDCETCRTNRVVQRQIMMRKPRKNL